MAPMPDMGTEGLDGQSRSAWLRSVFEKDTELGPAVRESLGPPASRPSRAQLDLGRGPRPVAQPSCWECASLGGSEARAAARERRVAVGAGKEPRSSSAFPGARARRRVLAKDRDGSANVAEDGV